MSWDASACWIPKCCSQAFKVRISRAHFRKARHPLAYRVLSVDISRGCCWTHSNVRTQDYSLRPLGPSTHSLACRSPNPNSFPLFPWQPQGKRWLSRCSSQPWGNKSLHMFETILWTWRTKWETKGESNTCMTDLYHGRSWGNINRFPRIGMVGGPGGRKDSRLPTDFSLRTTQSTQTRRAESKMKKAIECDNVHPSLIYIASSGVKKNGVSRGFQYN